MEFIISIREYQPEDAILLASILYNTVHKINSAHYTEEQVDVWAPASILKTEKLAKKFSITNPIIATVEDKIVGFAELEPNGHIDCFYCHHDWIGKGIGSALMKEIFLRAKKNSIRLLFSEVSITAKPFFERHGFAIIEKQQVIKNGVKFTNFKMEKTIS
ncbi:MAG: GNAT family N-acetyltransferase [Chlamydiae bacterium]|nr:GNAT family N-acetyltransferase [Chlamydiota bacterium]